MSKETFQDLMAQIGESLKQSSQDFMARFMVALRTSADAARKQHPFTLTEIRVADATGDEPPVIEGYAAVFNAESEDLGGFREIIRPGTFKKTINEADVRALINHDPTLVLGRSRAATLELHEDIHGLRVKIVPPDTSYARDLMESMKRGDIDQMSFGFETIRDEWLFAGEVITRTLFEVRLFDVSVVTYPAYPQTSAQVRSHVSELQSQNAAPPQEGHPAVDAAQAQARRESQRRRLAIAEAE